MHPKAVGSSRAVTRPVSKVDLALLQGMGPLFVLGLVLFFSGLMLSLKEIRLPETFLARTLPGPEGEIEVRFPASAEQLSLHLVTHCVRNCRQESYTYRGLLTHPSGRYVRGTYNIRWPSSRNNVLRGILARVDVEAGVNYRFAWNMSYRNPGVEPCLPI